MQPVIVMFIGTCADIRPRINIFSPVSGWKAESYRCFARQISFSLTPGGATPFLHSFSCNCYNVTALEDSRLQNDKPQTDLNELMLILLNGFHFLVIFLSFYFGSCSWLSWLNCQFRMHANIGSSDHITSNITKRKLADLKWWSHLISCTPFYEGLALPAYNRISPVCGNNFGHMIYLCYRRFTQVPVCDMKPGSQVSPEPYSLSHDCPFNI